tara:strand:+ start:2410 stop:2628 length:219 start_codon:yes stop_codon:yes gene_type:complete
MNSCTKNQAAEKALAVQNYWFKLGHIVGVRIIQDRSADYHTRSNLINGLPDGDGSINMSLRPKTKVEGSVTI